MLLISRTQSHASSVVLAQHQLINSTHIAEMPAQVLQAGHLKKDTGPIWAKKVLLESGRYAPSHWSSHQFWLITPNHLAQKSAIAAQTILYNIWVLHSSSALITHKSNLDIENSCSEYSGILCRKPGSTGFPNFSPRQWTCQSPRWWRPGRGEQLQTPEWWHQRPSGGYQSAAQPK